MAESETNRVASVAAEHGPPGALRALALLWQRDSAIPDNLLRDAGITGEEVEWLLLAGHEARQDEIPTWNPSLRELTFCGILVKRFRKSAPNQECLLSAFESQHWPDRIANPLPIDTAIPAIDRLRDAVKRLNKTLHSPVLRFGGDGTGEGVTWRALHPLSRADFVHFFLSPPIDPRQEESQCSNPGVPLRDEWRRTGNDREPFREIRL
jgi:hypothetical protein